MSHGLGILAGGDVANRRAAPTNPGDRVFFSFAGLWFVTLTLSGFSQSFYFRTQPEPLPTHQALHGVVFAAWVLLFFVQALLISTHRVRWHLRLGAAGFVVLLVMIPFGFHVVLVKTAAGLKSVDEAGFNLAQLTLGYDAWRRPRMLPLSLALLAPVWLLLWFLLSDVVFMRPIGEVTIKTLTTVCVW